MKKILLFTAIALLFVTTYGQELLVGGNMEDENDWTIIMMGSTNISTIEFNYTTDVPLYGSGGCLHLASSGGEHTLIYQTVDVEKDKLYAVSGAIKTGDVNKFWAQLFISTEQPVEGEDYNPPAGAKTHKYAGYNTWSGNDACKGINVDTLLQTGCDVGTALKVIDEDYVYVADTTATIYFAYKVGSGADAPFDILIDELSFMEIDTSSTALTEYSLVADIYMSNSALNVELPKAAYTKVSCYDLTGKCVYKNSFFSNRFSSDLNLDHGVYIIRVENADILDTKKVFIR